MEKYELDEIDKVIGILCKFTYSEFKKIDTNAAIALAKALEELLRARAMLTKN